MIGPPKIAETQNISAYFSTAQPRCVKLRRACALARVASALN